MLKKRCKNCGKPIPSSLNFCSRKCLEEYKERKLRLYYNRRAVNE